MLSIATNDRYMAVAEFVKLTELSIAQYGELYHSGLIPIIHNGGESLIDLEQLATLLKVEIDKDGAPPS